MRKFDHVTTDAAIQVYTSAKGVFEALLHEVRELSRKKPDATMSSSKVQLINNVLKDLLEILKGEPEGKYLQALEDADLPQVSDALMMMVQFEAALVTFREKYFRYVRNGYTSGDHFWITQEQLAAWEGDPAQIE